MTKTLFVVAAIGLTGCSSSPKDEPILSQHSQVKKPKVKTQNQKPQKSVLAYMGKPIRPPLTQEEIKKAKGGLVWRRVPYDELSEDEKKDPNFSIGINPKTGQVESMMNP